MTDQTEVRDSRDMDAEQERAAEKVAKLLALAANNPNAEEAARATEKAQAYLAQFNLDLATVEKASAGGGGSGAGKREDAAVAGGQYQYQRDLWKAIAKLNFCLYFSTEQKAIRSKTQRLSDGSVVNEPKYYKQRAHRLVGKVINTTSTRSMAIYLEQAIERLCRERYPGQSQFFSRDAISYRKGAASNLVDRLERKRRDNLREDEARRKRDAEAWAAAHPNVASDTALSLATFIDEETDRNNDFLHGAGWSAEQSRLRAESRKYWARYWEEQERKEAEWAAANPEEAARQRRKEEAAARRRSNSWGRATGKGSRGGDTGTNNQAFYAGMRAAEKIGLDPQAESSSSRTARLA